MEATVQEQKNVYELTQERLRVIFNEFDNVYVSFSGGKDSGVLLNLCIDYIRRNNLKRKIGVFHMDYEVQYKMTIDFVDSILEKNKDLLDVYRICLPFRVATSTSMYQSFWRPWDEEKKDLWVRQMPEGAMTIKDFPELKPDTWDYDFQLYFAQWLHKKKKATRTCCLVGIRTQESFSRWRCIFQVPKNILYHKYIWTSKIGNDIYNAYPIYDWKTTDVWTANGKFKWDYNPLYDLYYKAGISLERQRVASPFISEAIESLALYRAIDPDTLPEKTRNGYLRRLNVSIKFWRTKGGCLSDDVIQKLIDAKVPIEIVDKSNYRTHKHPVKMEYQEDIDIPEFREIPTYKRMCICILRNDHACKYMGFSPTKEEISKKNKIMENYKNIWR